MNNNLILDYIRATTNLYGIAPFDKVVEIYNQQNNDQIGIDDLEVYLDQDLSEYHVYVYYENFVHVTIMQFDEFDVVLAKKNNKPYYIPNRDELLKYVDINFYEKPQQYQDLLEYIKKNFFPKDHKKAEKLCADIRWECVFGRGIQEVFEHFNTAGVDFTDEQLNEVVQLVMALANNARIWENNGHTPNEIREKFEKTNLIPLPSERFPGVIQGDANEEIINELRYFRGEFPRGALKKAVKSKDEISPLLLGELNKVLGDPTIATEDEDYMLHLYSLYLLAQFREIKAFPKIVKLVSLKPDDVNFMLGDVITESLPSILYSTYNGDLSLLEHTIENPDIYRYVRGSALEVMGKLYLDGKISHEYLLAYLRKLIAERTYDIETEIDFYSFILGLVDDCDLEDMVEDIKALYDQDLIDLTVYGDFDNFLDWMRDEDKKRISVKYIDDVIEEMHWWACFQEVENEAPQLNIKKVGRNDSCPCGSGKKYKKCCLGKER